MNHNKGWKDQRINAVYQEMAEHYGTAIIPARVRAPKDKPNAEGSRYEIFRDEELPLLAPLPATPYELAEWRQATVQLNYHISFAGMLYSVPYEYIKHKVDVRVTDKTIEFFYNHNRIDTGEPVLENTDGSAKIVTKEAITQTIMSSSDKIHLLFFNACFSYDQGHEII